MRFTCKCCVEYYFFAFAVSAGFAWLPVSVVVVVVVVVVVAAGVLLAVSPAAGAAWPAAG